MVTINIATIPERESLLINTIKSLYDQADRINIWLNNYRSIPLWLSDTKINHHATFNNVGDAGKFGFKAKGFIFSCDDDIIYPPDYVKKMMDRIDNNIVTIHGKIFRPPIKSFYHDSWNKYRLDQELAEDQIIQIPGTGVMAYHSDTITFDRKDFKKKNMADIFVGIKAKQCNVSVICVKHKKDWVTLQHVDDSIWHRSHQSDYWQTKLINEKFA